MTQSTLLNFFKPLPDGVVPTLGEQSHENLFLDPSSQHKSPFSAGTSIVPEPEEPRMSHDWKVATEPSAGFPSFTWPLNPHVQISTVQPEHISPLKRLTASILPVRYPQKFYDETLTDPQIAELSRVVLYDERPVGWIRCRLETDHHETNTKANSQIYIQALCILAPYRNAGFATHLLNCVLQAEAVTRHHVSFVYAHVWENNEDALVWYEKRKFRRTLLVDQYYRRLKPSGAWICQKDLLP